MNKANKMLVNLPETVWVSVGELNPQTMEARAQRVLDGEALFAAKRGGLVSKDVCLRGPMNIKRGDIWVLLVKAGSMNDALKSALGVIDTPTEGEPVAIASEKDPVSLREAWMTSLAQENRPAAVRAAEQVIQMVVPLKYHPASGYVAGAVQFTTRVTIGPHDAVVVRGVGYPSAFGAPREAVDTVKAVATAARARRAEQPALDDDNADEVTC